MNSAILTPEPEMTTAVTNPRAASVRAWRISENVRAGDFPRENARWDAVLARDGSRDGKFVFAVSSTGIYCRPSCPAKRPRRENVSFFRCPQEAEAAGYRECLRCRPKALSGNPRQELIKSVCRYIEQHLDEAITLAAISAEFRLSPFHLQRTFKAVLGITPREYANSCRMRGFRQNLKAGHSVTRSMYEAGYNSTSRLYARTASELGMDPAKYRRGAIAAPIRYTCADSPLGRLLIAATEKGICSVQFAASDEELEQGLKQEFPFAIRRRDDRELAELAHKVLQRVNGKCNGESTRKNKDKNDDLATTLPLDIQATAFQRRVWSHLQAIAFGETRSYAQVAKAIRQPSAVRAVARACASNPVAIAIPCHRVVRSNGELGGYRWGIERKKALLEMEATSGDHA